MKRTGSRTDLFEISVENIGSSILLDISCGFYGISLPVTNIYQFIVVMWKRGFNSPNLAIVHDCTYTKSYSIQHHCSLHKTLAWRGEGGTTRSKVL